MSARRILKYNVVPGVAFELPFAQAKVLYFGEQLSELQNRLKVWVEGESEWMGGPYQQFVVYATGDEVGGHVEHRGTAICAGGMLVWHLYEILLQVPELVKQECGSYLTIDHITAYCIRGKGHLFLHGDKNGLEWKDKNPGSGRK